MLGAITVPHVVSLRCCILNVEFARGKGTLSACQFAPKIGSMIQAQHEIAANCRHVSTAVCPSMIVVSTPVLA
jgi:hypothetical protein